MIVKNFMKHKVVSISARATVREAAAQIVKNRIGLLPVIDEYGKPLGVLGLRDLLKLELPDFVTLLPDIDFVHDFGAVETTRPTKDELNHPVTTLMEPVITLEENCGLLRAYAMMLQHKLLDMPVVNNRGELTGIISWVDIGTAIIASWQPKLEKEK